MDETMPAAGRDRYGSPTFYSLLEEMAVTHDKKSHDYASEDDPSGNYHFSGQLALLFTHSPEDIGFITRLAEKIYRLANLERDGKIPLNEAVDDTERDIAVITTLWMADRRDRRSNKLKMISKVREQMNKGEWSGLPQESEYKSSDPTGKARRY